MGIFSKFMESVVAKRVRSYSKSTARTMMISALAFREKFKEHSPSSVQCGRWALDTRPYWRKAGEHSFVYERTGEVYEFSDTMSLADLIEEVVGAEVGWILIEAGQGPLEIPDLLLLARQEARDTIRR